VAEAIRFYSQRFWRSLALGVAVAAVDLAAIPLAHVKLIVFEATIAAVLLSAAFVAASVFVSGARPDPADLARAWVAGVLAYIPFPVLTIVFILPGLAWLALVGLVVPVIVIERLPIRAAFRRAVVLARADYVHALGSLSTLVILYALTRFVLFFLLRGGSGIAERSAGVVADIVLSPLLFLGAALLYFDQAARAVRSGSQRRRSRDADLHHALQAHRAGRPDAEVESRPAARGQS
jgi:hypothetical protein